MSRLKNFLRSVVNIPTIPIDMYKRRGIPRGVQQTAYGDNASIKYSPMPERAQIWDAPQRHELEVESTYDMRPKPEPPKIREGDYSPHSYSKDYKPGMSSRAGTGLHPNSR